MRLSVPTWPVTSQPRRLLLTRGRRRPRITFVLLMILGCIVAGTLLGGLTAGADPAPSATSPCPDLTRRYEDQLPAGWTIECLPELPEAWRAAAGESAVSSMTDRDARRIVVLDDQSAAWTEASVAHELAHAEASSWPPELRTAFARAVGEERWAGRGGPASPMEVFAESSVRCRGLRTEVSYPLVPCDLVEAARAAGGAAAPLPVSGPLPTS